MRYDDEERVDWTISLVWLAAVAIGVVWFVGAVVTARWLLEKVLG